MSRRRGRTTKKVDTDEDINEQDAQGSDKKLDEQLKAVLSQEDLQHMTTEKKVEMLKFLNLSDAAGSGGGSVSEDTDDHELIIEETQEVSVKEKDKGQDEPVPIQTASRRNKKNIGKATVGEDDTTGDELEETNGNKGLRSKTKMSQNPGTSATERKDLYKVAENQEDELQSGTADESFGSKTLSVTVSETDSPKESESEEDITIINHATFKKNLRNVKKKSDDSIRESKGKKRVKFMEEESDEEEEPTSKKKATSKLSTRRIGSRSQKLEENLENQTGRRRARNNTSKYGSQKEKDQTESSYDIEDLLGGLDEKYELPKHSSPKIGASVNVQRSCDKTQGKLSLHRRKAETSQASVSSNTSIDSTASTTLKQSTSKYSSATAAAKLTNASLDISSDFGISTSFGTSKAVAEICDNLLITSDESKQDTSKENLDENFEKLLIGTKAKKKCGSSKKQQGDVTSDLYTSDDVIPSDMLTNDSSRDTIENEKEDNVEKIPKELVSEDTSKSNDDSENVYYDATQEMDGEKEATDEQEETLIPDSQEQEVDCSQIIDREIQVSMSSQNTQEGESDKSVQVSFSTHEDTREKIDESDTSVESVVIQDCATSRQGKIIEKNLPVENMEAEDSDSDLFDSQPGDTHNDSVDTLPGEQDEMNDTLKTSHKQDESNAKEQQDEKNKHEPVAHSSPDHLERAELRSRKRKDSASKDRGEEPARKIRGFELDLGPGIKVKDDANSTPESEDIKLVNKVQARRGKVREARPFYAPPGCSHEELVRHIHRIRGYFDQFEIMLKEQQSYGPTNIDWSDPIKPGPHIEGSIDYKPSRRGGSHEEPYITPWGSPLRRENIMRPRCSTRLKQTIESQTHHPSTSKSGVNVLYNLLEQGEGGPSCNRIGLPKIGSRQPALKLVHLQARPPLASVNPMTTTFHQQRSKRAAAIKTSRFYAADTQDDFDFPDDDFQSLASRKIQRRRRGDQAAPNTVQDNDGVDDAVNTVPETQIIDDDEEDTQAYAMGALDADDNQNYKNKQPQSAEAAPSKVQQMKRMFTDFTNVFSSSPTDTNKPDIIEKKSQTVGSGQQPLPVTTPRFITYNGKKFLVSPDASHAIEMVQRGDGTWESCVPPNTLQFTKVSKGKSVPAASSTEVREGQKRLVDLTQPRPSHGESVTGNQPGPSQGDSVTGNQSGTYLRLVNNDIQHEPEVAAVRVNHKRKSEEDSGIQTTTTITSHQVKKKMRVMKGSSEDEEGESSQRILQPPTQLASELHQQQRQQLKQQLDLRAVRNEQNLKYRHEEEEHNQQVHGQDGGVMHHPRPFYGVKVMGPESLEGVRRTRQGVFPVPIIIRPKVIVKTAECPMCSKMFTEEEIHEHAFNCQGVTEEDPTENTKSEAPVNVNNRNQTHGHTIVEPRPPLRRTVRKKQETDTVVLLDDEQENLPGVPDIHSSGDDWEPNRKDVKEAMNAEESDEESEEDWGPEFEAVAASALSKPLGQHRLRGRGGAKGGTRGKGRAAGARNRGGGDGGGRRHKAEDDLTEQRPKKSKRRGKLETVDSDEEEIDFDIDAGGAKTACPICNRLYPVKVIAVHADQCVMGLDIQNNLKQNMLNETAAASTSRTTRHQSGAATGGGRGRRGTGHGGGRRRKEELEDFIVADDDEIEETGEYEDESRAFGALHEANKLEAQCVVQCDTR